MRRFAKIAATLGPRSSSKNEIKALLDAGVDVFRLNFSHGSHEGHAERINIIRTLEKEAGRPLSIVLDLQGPKLRVGTFEKGSIVLKKGQDFSFFLDPYKGDEKGVTLPHPEIFQAAKKGIDLLLDDGKLRIRLKEVQEKCLVGEVLVEGELSNRKGVNVPGVLLPLSPLTDKDREDLTFGLSLGVDWIALSFVQRPEDILEARELIQGRASLIAKLEKPLAIENLEEIVTLTDALIVARGDLGVEMPPEDVPILQRRIIRSCRQAGKPVMVATQMLDSMVHSPSPTRAEASDVATAIYEGADAVMLSAESAVGDYPVEAVQMMDRIIRRVEQDSLWRTLMDTTLSDPEETTSDAITLAAHQVAHTLKAAAIATFTSSGKTTLRAARTRPDCPILGITPHEKTARLFPLVWGVYPVVSEDVSSFTEAVERSCAIAVKEGFAQLNDRIVVTAGVPFGVSGSTNILRVARIRNG